MSVFSWCLTNKHDECKGSFQRYILVPQKKRGQPPNRLDYLDEWVYCECTKRGCECYKARKTREETTAPKKKAKPRKRKT